MPEQNAEMMERSRVVNSARERRMRASIANRWNLTEWDVDFPWWRKSPEVRILIYIDGDLRLLDFIHVRTLLEAQPNPHVTFKITTVHRDDQSVRLTDLNLVDDFDELWLFGSRSAPPLPPEERLLVESFMAAPKLGGVLVTGDHDALGSALAQVIPRVGAMRRWDVTANGPNRHSSLEEGIDADMTFSAQDEADDLAQTIHYRRFPIDAPDGVTLHPHPVLCGINGAIDVLPDHQHEGEAIAPTDLTDWPANDGNAPERPFVIAFADIKDPQVHYRQFGVISAYNGHLVNVGRIVADSSWHHWLNSNLDQLESSPRGQAALKKIDSYFLNCATWLAPGPLQEQVRLAAWWSIVWSGEVVEIPANAPLSYFGAQAIKELRRFASSCAASEWILGSDTFNRALTNPALAQTSNNVSLLNLRVEQFVAGGILKALMKSVGPHHPESKFPTEAPPDEDLEKAINEGTADALSTLEAELANEASKLRTTIASFRSEVRA